jgi:hypothetical protein
MRTNTCDMQTTKFIAIICQSLPPMLSETMQCWIQNPQALKRVLGHALNLPPAMVPTDERHR